jgi:hypothetical protein
VRPPLHILTHSHNHNTTSTPQYTPQPFFDPDSNLLYLAGKVRVARTHAFMHAFIHPHSSLSFFCVHFHACMHPPMHPCSLKTFAVFLFLLFVVCGGGRGLLLFVCVGMPSTRLGVNHAIDCPRRITTTHPKTITPRPPLTFPPPIPNPTKKQRQTRATATFATTSACPRRPSSSPSPSTGA